MLKYFTLMVAGVLLLIFGITGMASPQSNMSIVKPDTAQKIIVGLTVVCGKCPWIDPSCPSESCHQYDIDDCEALVDTAWQEYMDCNMGHPSKKCVMTGYDICWVNWICKQVLPFTCFSADADCQPKHGPCTSYNVYSFDDCDTQSM